MAKVNSPEYWRVKALQQRRYAHQMKKIYTPHNWRIYFKMDMQSAIRSWQYYRELLKGKINA